MALTSQGSMRLFRLAGIDVYLHWSWFLVAYYEINQRAGRYSSPAWNVLEYLALFGIVLMHEFGHSLACRQVGGRADRIVLWPLGGVAFVQPPERPGAILWSLAAGPLVNVVLFPVLLVLSALMDFSGAIQAVPNLARLLYVITFINAGLLMFNLLPVYPLDGGQILSSILWFILGRARGLMVASVIGLAGAGGLCVWAYSAHSIWLGILAFFVGARALAGVSQARILAWVQPAMEHLNRATAAMQRGDYRAENLAHPDRPVAFDWQEATCSVMTVDLAWFAKQGFVQEAMGHDQAISFYRERLEQYLDRRFDDDEWQAMIDLGQLVDTLRATCFAAYWYKHSDTDAGRRGVGPDRSAIPVRRR